MNFTPFYPLVSLLLLTFSLTPPLRAQEKPVPAAGKPKEGAEKSSLFVRSEPPEPDEFKRHIPPWPVVRESDVTSVPKSDEKRKWTRRDGRSAVMGFNFHGWKEQTGPDGKKEYAAVAECLTASGDRVMKLADLQLIPADEEQLRLSLWKTYLTYTALDEAQKAQKTALLREAEKFTGGIETYGDKPAKQESQERRLPGPEDLGNLPAVREPVPVELENPSPSGRKKGKLQLVDWAMTPPDVFGAFHARIRWTDGLEETIWARDLRVDLPVTIRKQKFPKVDGATVNLLYFRDWAWLKQKGGEIPGKELKVRALKQMLANWWLWTAPRREQAKEDLASQNEEELRKPVRFGVKLKFPGLPPEGFRPMEDDGMDRLKIPVYNHEEYEDRSGCNTTASAATFLLWWDQEGKPAVPQSGNFERKVKWLHNVLSRGRNRDPESAMTRYAADRLKGEAVFHTATDYDYSPENIARYVAGGHATILSVSRWRDQQRLGDFIIPVISASADGSATLSAWGCKITGRWKEVKLPGVKKTIYLETVPDQCWEFEIDNRDELPEHFIKNKTRLIIGDSYYSSLVAVTPYLKNPATPPAAKK